jgi:four helix bundle protein
MTPQELKNRTKRFALDVLELLESLPPSLTHRVVSGQLSRSAPSTAANYRAACRARSKAEFLSKLGIVEEEVDESLFWLEVLLEASPLDPRAKWHPRAEELRKEADELLSIIVASRKTAGGSPDNPGVSSR